MNIGEVRKARTICAILGGGLGLAVAALGQSGMTPNPDGSSPATLTPQQEAETRQLQQMDNAAMTALNTGRYAEAIADARQAMALDADDILGPKVLPRALEAEGNIPGALQAYKALADRGSYRPEDLMPYALLLLHQGQWGAALAAYEKALPYVGEGNLLRASNDFSLNTPNPAALEAAIHVARGLTYSVGDLVTPHPQDDKALTEFQRATVLAPASPLASYYYGYGLQKMGRKTEAQAAFKKAAALDQGSGDVKAAAEAALAGR